MKKLALFSVFVLLLSYIQAQPLYLNKTYNFPAAKGCIIMDTLGYTFVTTHNTGTAQLIDLVQLDLHGNIAWTSEDGLNVKKYVPVCIMRGILDGFVIAGTVYDSLNPVVNNPKGSDIFLAYFGDDGTKKGIKVFGRSYVGEQLAQCIQARNGDFLLAGVSYRDTIGSRFYSARIGYLNDSLKWEQTYTAGTNPQTFSLTESADQTFLLAGEDGNGIMQNALTIKADINGNKLWSKQYVLSHSAANREEYISSAIPGKNKSYLLAGAAFDPTLKSKPLYILSIDSLGNKIWKKPYGDSATGQFWKPLSKLILNADSTYMIAGEYYNDIYANAKPDKGFVLKFNMNGDTLISKKFRAYLNTVNSFNNMVPARYSGYFLCGHTGVTLDSSWVIKLDCMLNDSVQYPEQPNCCVFSELAKMDFTGSVFTMCKGEKVTINAMPRGLTYQWSTGATIDSIIVTGSGTYSVTITGAGACSKTFAPATFVVEDTVKPVITQNGGILKSNYSIGNIWYKDGSPIPGAIDSILNTNGNGGSYVLCVNNVCGEKCSAPLVLTGIGEISSARNHFIFYPNPFDDHVFLKYSGIMTGSILQLKDITGRLVLEHKISSDAAASDIVLSTSDLAEGVYIGALISATGKTIQTGKLIKLASQ